MDSRTWRVPTVLLNALILCISIAALAVAQNAQDSEIESSASRRAGDEIELGRRNPSSGDVNAETAIVAREGNDGLALRLTNTASGGRANSSTCTNNGTDPTDGCHVYVNKGNGVVASFRSAGNGVAPFAVRDTNNGRVDNLNSQYVSGHSVECAGRTVLLAGVCVETPLRNNNAPANWTTASNACRDAGGRLPSHGEAALLGTKINATAFGVSIWTDDTGRDGGIGTAAVTQPNGAVAHDNRANLHLYRCVTSPITLAVTPPAP